MTNKIIAVVKLTPGNIGWYDELTGTHLTLARTTANVYSGSNTSNLLKALNSNIISVVSGSLIEGSKEATYDIAPKMHKVVSLTEDKEVLTKETKSEVKKTTKTKTKSTTPKKSASKTKTTKK